MQSGFDTVLTSLGVRQQFLLAVSGGIDSMVMLDLFSRSSLHPDFAIAHCNFHLRGEESDSDEALVGKWAKDHGSIFNVTDFDTVGYAKSNGISIEMAARELRYGWFSSICRELGYGALAVAHNLNDNAETMILNLLRGTGVKGMTGMKRKSSLPGAEGVLLVRPLLDFSRKEIYEYAVEKGLAWHEDSTNSETAYKRNRIRNEIFPLFEKLNPSFLKTLSQDAERFSQVQDIADDCFVSIGEKVLRKDEDGSIRVDRHRLKELRHWDYFLFRLLSPLGFTPSAISDLTVLLKDGSTVGGKAFTAPEHSVVATSNHLVISPQPLGLASFPADDCAGILVKGEGEYALDGVKFIVETVSKDSLVKIEESKCRFRPESGAIFIDSRSLPFPFSVRRWIPGDWIRPLGMKGRKKLSDLFVDLKAGLPEKRKALVVAGGGSHVLALLGSRIDDSVKITESTSSVIRIRLI